MEIGSKKSLPRWMLAASLLVMAGCTGRKYLKGFDVEPPQIVGFFHVPERVTAGIESNFSPNLSPNGAFVLYTSDRNGNKDIWEKKSNGGYPRQLTTHAADDFSPVISPNGRYAAFVSRRADAAGDVHILDLRGSVKSLLTTSEGPVTRIEQVQTEDFSPSWFPDSERILFSSRRSGETEAQIMEADVGDNKARPFAGLRGQQPAVSPDGNLVAYVRNGALHLYDIATSQNIELTKGGRIQDGQPAFSLDGKSILFIRYLADTSEDGVIDGDDRPAIWHLDLEYQRSQKVKENYRIKQLTSYAHSALYPNVRGSLLYFTMQDRGGLDIFALPEQGQLKFIADVDQVEREFNEQSNVHDRLLVLRSATASFARLGKLNEVQGLSLRELDFLAEQGHRLAAEWTRDKIRQNFPDAVLLQSSAEITMAEMYLGELLFPREKSAISESDRQMLIQKSNQISSIIESIPQNLAAAQNVRAKGLLAKARIAASLGQYGEGLNLVTAASSEAVDERLKSTIAICRGRLIPYLAAKNAAVVILVDVARTQQKHLDVVADAAHAAVELTLSMDGDVEAHLLRLIEMTSDLPILPAMARLSLSERYMIQGQTAAAKNELRTLIRSYPNSPEQVLAAAARLAGMEESAGNIAQAEEDLVLLVKSLNRANFRDLNRAKAMRAEFLLRKAERLMKQREPALAVKEYRKVIKFDPGNVMASRGMVDAFYQQGSLELQIDEFKSRLRQNPNDALSMYLLAYSLSYNISKRPSPEAKLEQIEDAVVLIEKARRKNGRIAEMHQTLGKLYLQKDYWLKRYYAKSGAWRNFQERLSLVADYLGFGEPNWTELAVDAYLTAFFLVEEDSVSQAGLAEDLADAFFNLKNFARSLRYYMERIKSLDQIPTRSQTAEARLFRKAGRAAFYEGDLVVAEALQQKALGLWRESNSMVDVAYSLDALALTLREMGRFKTATVVYQQLLEVQMGLGDLSNVNKVHINLAYCQAETDEYRNALRNLKIARDQLNDKNRSLNLSVQSADKDKIQIDVTGQTSAAKGFDRFMLQSLIYTIEAEVYDKMQRPDLAQKSRVAKLELTKKHRDHAVEELNAEEEVHADSLAILYNSIALGDVSSGNMESAKGNFRLAMAEESLRKESGGERGVYSNFVSLARSQLRLADLGVLPDGDRHALDQELTQRIQSLGEQAKGNPTARSAQATLKSIQAQLTTVEKPLVDESLAKIAESKKLTLDIAVRGKTTQSLMLRYDFPRSVEPKKSNILERSSFRKLAISEEAIEWKLYLKLGMWRQAVNTLTRQVRKGYTFPTPNDRRLFQLAFEGLIQQHGENADKRRLEIFSEYAALNSAEIVNRLGQSNQKKRQAFVSELIDKPSSFAGLVASEAIVFIHQVRSNQYWCGIVTRDFAKFPAKDWTDLPSALSWVEATLGERQRVQMIPTGGAYAKLRKLPWPKVLAGRDVAVIPSVSVIPLAKSLRRSGIRRVGHLPQSGVLDPRTIESANRSRLYATLTPSLDFFRSKSISFDFLQLDAALDVNELRPDQTFLQFDREFDGMGFSSLGLVDMFEGSLPSVSVLLMTNKVVRQKAVPSSVSTWQSLYLAGLAAGVPTTVLVDGKGIDAEKWSAFYAGDAVVTARLRRAGISGVVMGDLGAIASGVQVAQQDVALLKAALRRSKIKPDRGAQVRSLKSLVDAYRRNSPERQFYLVELVGVLSEEMQEYGEALFYQQQLAAGKSGTDGDVVRLKAYQLAIKAQDHLLMVKLRKQLRRNLASKNNSFRADVEEAYGHELAQSKDFENAVKAFQKSRKLFLASGNKERAGYQRLNIGLVQQSLFDFDAAEKSLKGAVVELRGRSGVMRDKALLSLADFYVDNDKGFLAIAVLADLVERGAKSPKILMAYLRALLSVGYTQVAGATLSELRSQYSALNSSETVDLKRLEVQFLLQTGKFDAAIRIASEMAEVNREVGTDMLSQALAAKGSTDLAIRKLEATDWAAARNLQSWNRQIQLAQLYTRSGNLVKAQEILEQLRSKKGPLDLELLKPFVRAQLLLGELALVSKDPVRASNILRLVIEKIKGKQLGDLNWQSNFAMGRALLADGNPDQALPFFQRATLFLKARPPGFPERSDPLFSGGVSPSEVYSHYTKSLLSKGRIVEAYAARTWERRRRLLDGIEFPLFLNGSAGLQALYTSFGRAVSSEAQPALHKLPVIGAAVTGPSFQPREIVKGLAENAAVIDYSVNGNDLVIFVLAGGRTHARQLDSQAETIMGLVEQYQKALAGEQFVDDFEQKLSDAFIRPIADLISKSQRLHIMVPPEFDQMPFAALTFGSARMIERFLMSFHNTLDSVEQKSLPLSNHDRVLAVIGADSDYILQKQARGINRYFPATAVLENHAAGGANVVKNLQAFEAMHLNGTLQDNAEPGVAFTLNSLAGGRLPISQLLPSTSHLKFATYSAPLGSDVPFFRQVLSGAGCRASLFSRWAGKSAAGGLVLKRFYRLAASGVPPVAALRKSQLLVRQQHPHSSRWASMYIVEGN